MQASNILDGGIRCSILTPAIQANDVRQIPKRFAALFFVVSLAALGACSVEFHKDELIGTYVLNTGPATNILELKSDGGYVPGHQEKGSAKKTPPRKRDPTSTRHGQSF